MAIDFFIFLPEIYVSLWLIVLLIQFTIVSKYKNIWSTEGRLKNFISNPIPCLISILIALSIYYFVLQTAGFSVYSSFSGFYCNQIIFYIRLLLSFLFILYLVHLKTNTQTLSFYSYEFYIVLFFSFLSLHFILMSRNFLNLFIFVEIFSLCVYYLVGSKKNSVKGIESTVKYFIFGSFSSALLLFGIFLVYYSTGSIDLFDIFNLTYQNEYYTRHFAYICGAYLICFSFLIKIGASFFFFWMVEVYSGLSFNMLIFLNIFPKFVYIITIVNMIEKFNIFHLSVAVKFFILSSLMVGLLGALNETKTKRFLVFTSLYNITFLSMPFWGQSKELIGVLIFFSSIYLLNFFVFMVLFANLRDVRTNIISKNLVDLHEIKVQNPRLAWVFIFFTLFASGLPMTAVFLAKFSFFLELSRLIYVGVLLYFLILSALSLFYYIRIVKIILQGTKLPNILLEPVSFAHSFIYSFTIWFNFISILMYDDLAMLLNLFIINATGSGG